MDTRQPKKLQTFELPESVKKKLIKAEALEKSLNEKKYSKRALAASSSAAAPSGTDAVGDTAADSSNVMSVLHTLRHAKSEAIQFAPRF
jgi:hypothetical protein